MIEEEKNILEYDSLFEDSELNIYVRNIQIDGSFQRLINAGILSLFVKKEIAYINFTIEDYYHFALADYLESSKQYNDFLKIKTLFLNNKLPGIKTAISKLLIMNIEKNEVNLFINFVKENEFIFLELCIDAFIISIQINKIELTLKILNSTKNDFKWRFFRKVIERLELEEKIGIRDNLLNHLLQTFIYKTYDEYYLALKALNTLNHSNSEVIINNLNINLEIISSNLELFIEYNNYLIKNAEYDKSLKLLLEYKLNNKEDNHLINSKIGEVYYRKGNYSKTIEFYNISENILSSNKFDIIYLILLYNQIGDLYQNTGNYELAIQYHLKNLEIKIDYFGTYHRQVAYSYNGLGAVYFSKNEYDLALDYFKKCLNIRVKILDEQHLDLANSYGNIGDVYLRKDDFENAIILYDKSLSIRISQLGEIHPYTASSYLRLGDVYLHLSDLEKALEYCTKSFKIRKETLGSDHPLVAYSLKSIAEVYIKKNEFKLAINYLRDSEIIELIKLGSDHPEYHGTLLKLFKLFTKINDIEESKKYLILLINSPLDGNKLKNLLNFLIDQKDKKLINYFINIITNRTKIFKIKKIIFYEIEDLFNKIFLETEEKMQIDNFLKIHD